MALGGGTFVSQNKKLPGSYINFVSAARASASLSTRGIAAMGLPLDWGVDNEVFTVTAAEFQKNALGLFGYHSGHEKLRAVRELFRNATMLHLFKLTSSSEGKASNDLATAKRSGARGNDLLIAVERGEGGFAVRTLLEGAEVDSQTVADASELQDNDFVTFDRGAELSATAGMPLTGGETKEASVQSHVDFLNKVEPYFFNAIGCACTDTEIADLYVSFVKRLREEVGVKTQAVLFRRAADYEGVVNVENAAVGAGIADMVYWVTGVIAGTAVNRSATNLRYDGELKPFVDYGQSELEKCVDGGKFTLHRVENEVRVLTDINSLTSFSSEKNEDFQRNQTIRVIDCIGNDIASMFNKKYIGKIRNNQSGRMSFWSDIVKHHRELERLEAIEEFSESDVVVEQGETKRSVVVSDTVRVVDAMEQLYMTVVVA